MSFVILKRICKIMIIVHCKHVFELLYIKTQFSHPIYRVLHISLTTLTFNDFFCLRGLKRGILVFLRSTGSKMGGCQNSKCKNKKKCFYVIYVVKWMFLGTVFSLKTLTTCNFCVSWPRKNLNTSFESPKREIWSQ